MSFRRDKLASLIQQELAQLIHHEYPLLVNCLMTISHVKVSPDLSWANIYCTSLLDDMDMQEQIALLERNAGHIRYLLGQRVYLKKLPALRFFPDTVSARSRRIDALLNKKK